MSVFTDRITEVLRAHVFDGCDYCSCGERFMGGTYGSGWAGHVAERVAALLTEETRILTNGWVWPSGEAPYVAAISTPPAVITEESRLVSDWAAVQS